MTERVMVDIETLGLEPGAVILAIGAVRFSREGLGDEFYVEIDIDSAKNHGLHVDEETLSWWRGQPPDLAPLWGETPLPDALAEFRAWADPLDEVWANSPSFDCEMLEAAFDAVHIDGLEEPWEYYHERDVRTVRNLPGAVEVERPGDELEHGALDDAKHQAREVAATLRSLDEQEVAADD